MAETPPQATKGSPVKVGLVIEHLDPARGGRETSTAQLAEALAGKGCSVTVFCQSANVSSSSISVRTLPCCGSRAGRFRRFAFKTVRAATGEGVDVLHAMLPLPGANVYQPRGGTLPAQAEAARRRRGPLRTLLGDLGRCCSAHRRLLSQWEARLAADPAVACLAGSEMVAEEFRRFYPKASNVRVVRNAVDVPTIDEAQRAIWREDRRGRLGLGDDEPLFLTVAKNFDLKGVDFAIRALAVRAAGNLPGRLVVVGRNTPDRYVRLVRTLNITGRIHFLPATDNIFPWYSAADVVVLLSWYDACSRVVLEATRWAVPSVTTRFNGAADVLADGAGLVVDRPDDTPAVAAALAGLADPAERVPALAACRKAADSLALDAHVETLLDVYREVSHA